MYQTIAETKVEKVDMQTKAEDAEKKLGESTRSEAHLNMVIEDARKNQQKQEDELREKESRIERLEGEVQQCLQEKETLLENMHLMQTESEAKISELEDKLASLERLNGVQELDVHALDH